MWVSFKNRTQSVPTYLCASYIAQNSANFSTTGKPHVDLAVVILERVLKLFFTFFCPAAFDLVFKVDSALNAHTYVLASQAFHISTQHYYRIYHIQQIGTVPILLVHPKDTTVVQVQQARFFNRLCPVVLPVSVLICRVRRRVPRARSSEEFEGFPRLPATRFPARPSYTRQNEKREQTEQEIRQTDKRKYTYIQLGIRATQLSMQYNLGTYTQQIEKIR